MQFTRTAAPSLALVTLVSLGIAAQQPTYAQVSARTLLLNSGDNLTVSGAGTYGTSGNSPVAAAGISSYFDNGIRNANGNATVVETDGTAVFTLSNGGSAIGGQYATNESYSGLEAFGSSTITITGGTVGSTGGQSFGLYSFANSRVNVSGGTISGTGLQSDGLLATGGSIVNITGGSIVGGQNGRVLYTSSGSTINISGGTINAAQGGTGFVTNNGGTIDLFGTGFQDGNGHFFTGPITSGSGNITGTFLNGQLFNTSYNVLGGIIEFNVGAAPAPEPSQFTALGMGVFGLSVLALKVRRRRVG